LHQLLSDVRLYNTTIRYNSAFDYGGCLQSYNGNLEIYNSTFEYCRAQYGGALSFLCSRTKTSEVVGNNILSCNYIISKYKITK
jgi:hypothetical protein